MRIESLRDVVKVWLYAMASFLLGAWMTPLIYAAGRALSEVSSDKQTNSIFHWLADISRAADFPSFFSASLFIAATLLFLPFAEWFGGGRGGNGLGKLIALLVPVSTGSAPHLLVKNRHGFWHFGSGFWKVAAIFLVIAAVTRFAGLTSWTLPPNETTLGLLVRALALALGWGFAQEIFFRGIATGIFLKALPPAPAIGLSAVLFAMAILLTRSAGLGVADPDAAGVGFELLGKILRQLASPEHIITHLVPFLVLGALLAYARWRTASLWLSVGINAGWIFANHLTAYATQSSDGRSLFTRLLFGESPLDCGLLPVAGFIAVAIMIKPLLPTHHVADPAP